MLVTLTLQGKVSRINIFVTRESAKRMTLNGETSGSAMEAKAKYHHGDLREALIAAAFELVSEHGVDKFSLADACRLAGVSTAAPYRHFKDREELLAEVCARGFEIMTEAAQQAVQKNGEGTLDGIVAMGQSYVAFAVAHEGLFRLMFGQKLSLEELPHVLEIGTNCFGYLIEQITKYCAANGLEKNADDIAVQLWTFVHGASSLLIDGKYDRVTPGLDVDRMIASATPLLLYQPRK